MFLAGSCSLWVHLDTFCIELCRKKENIRVLHLSPVNSNGLLNARQVPFKHEISLTGHGQGVVGVGSIVALSRVLDVMETQSGHVDEYILILSGRGPTSMD